MAEVEESIKKQISRLAFGSLEMTIYRVFNRTRTDLSGCNFPANMVFLASPGDLAGPGESQDGKCDLIWQRQ